MKKVLVAVAIVGLMAGPVWADSVHIGNTTNNTTNNQGGQGGTGIGIGGNQHQGQQQGQSQVGVNVQGQKQSADNAGNSQSIKVESQMNPGLAVAPGLTSGGSQVCLGSFSVGLSGPMAGVAFGKTVQDKGCAKRHLFILLHNVRDPRAAAVLESLYKESMGDEVKGVTPQVLSVIEPTIAQAMEQTQQTAVTSVQGN